MDVKTVRRTLRGRKQPARKRKSKLDPYRALIKELVLHRELSAVRVLEELRAVGYDGGYSILKSHVRSLRPRPTKRPHLRFETDPGVQAQVDLSPYTVELGCQPVPVVCFSMVFGYSRWQFIRFVLHADANAVCHSHVLAFEEAGGVPQEILYDRMKQVVLESYADRVVFHPLFLGLVRKYGFRAVPLSPGYKEGKGKVENPFRYLEGSLLKGRMFHDLADLNRQGERWLADIARVRCHGTTKERPVDRLDVERPRLIPLPPTPFVAAKVEDRIVGDDFCVAWNTSRYSVPPRYAGRTVQVQVLEGVLEVYLEAKPIAQHSLRDTRYKRYIAPEHEAEFRQHSTSRHVLHDQFLKLGKGAEAFAEGLVQDHGGAAGYHMANIFKLVDRVGVPRVVEAMRHAARYGAFGHTSVKRIVDGKKPSRKALRIDVPAGPAPAHIAEYLRAAGHRQRSLREYEQLLQKPHSSPSEEREKKENKEHGD